MARKRKYIPKKHGRTKHNRSKGLPKHTAPSKIASQIITFLFTQQRPAAFNDISAYIQQVSKKKLQEELSELIQKKEIFASGKKKFQLADKNSFLQATLEMHQRGFGFAVRAEPQNIAEKFLKDPFIGKNSMGSARHGDRVLIKLKQSKRDDRPEAEVIAVLERGSETLVGFFKNGSPPVIIAEDPRYPAKILIPQAPPETIKENTVVLVQILPEKNDSAGFLNGKILEVLGDPDNIDVQMRIVIENNALPHLFSDEALNEANKLCFSPDDYTTREDLRATLHYTIDGETAKDFDDAVCVEKTRTGYRLFVSIADVSHFVKADSALDKEAYLRGTSIYFPGRVIPMLPENLSNNLCSLVPYEDRLTFTAILDFDRSGNLFGKRFTKSVIRSKHRFTYTTVKQILIDKDASIRKEHKSFLTPLKWAKELAQQLHEKRMARGSIGFNLPEPEISLDDKGKISAITRKKRNFAHQIIEEFMLIANEAVARFFTDKDIPFLYRIHEKPSINKVEEFSKFATTLGLELPKQHDEPSPSWFGQVLTLVAETPAEYVVNNLLLRTMQQARYSPQNQGHFGLAATDYTHFTSPIRRYPDLIVHRLLNSCLEGIRTLPSQQLEVAGAHLSERERTAINGEREINDRLKIFYMEQHIGETFRAVVSGILETVIFVELIDLFISGSIDISLLRDDYYLYDIKRYRFIGEISGKTYTLGDEINAQLIDVDLRKRRIHFGPSDMFYSE